MARDGAIIAAVERLVRIGMTCATAAIVVSAGACAKKQSDDPPPAPQKTVEAATTKPVVESPVVADEAAIAGASMTLGSARYRLRAPLAAARFDGDDRVIGLLDGALVTVDAATGEVTSLGAVVDAHALAAMPGGGFAVGGDGLRFVDAAGALTRTLPIDAGTITAIAVTSDGKQLVLSGYQGAILIIDAASGEELARVPPTAEGYTDVALIGDTRLAARRGESVVVLDRAGGKELVKVPAPQGSWALAGAHLATLAGGNPIDGYDVDVWSAETGKLVVGIHREREVRALAWMADGATLLIGDEAGTIDRYKIAGSAATPAGPTISLHGGGIAELLISPSGTRLAAITAHGAVRFLDTAADAASDPGPGHLGAVERLAFSGEFLISGGSDATIWTWELSGSRRVAKIELDGELMAMTTAPDEGLYAQVDVYARPAGEGYTSLARHLIEGWTLSGARKLSRELEHGADAIKYCGLRNGIQAVTGSRWKEIDPTTFDVTERGRSTGREGRLSPTGRFAAFEGHGALIVVDDQGTHRLGTARCSQVHGVAFDQAGEVVAMTDGTGAMRMWRVDGSLIAGVSAPGASGASDGVVLPDQSTALFITRDGLLVWDQAKATAGKIALEDASALAVTPAGDRLAVGFRHGQVGIFELAALRAMIQPVTTSAAPELTDDDCHQLRPEDYASTLVGGSSDGRRFGDPPSKDDGGSMGLGSPTADP